MSGEQGQKSGFERWCERVGVEDPGELAEIGQYMNIPASNLPGMAQSEGWLERLKTEFSETKARRIKWLGEWVQRNVGPVAFRELPGSKLHKLLPPQLAALTRRWEPGLGVLVVGPTGIGKSAAACFLARQATYEAMQADNRWHRDADGRGDGETFVMDSLERESASARYGVLWTSASRLSRARKGHPLGQGEAKLVESAMSVKVLVIDDLGWEPIQDTVCADVLAERYDHGRTNVVTSGHTLEKLSERYGAALVRRIHEIRGKSGVALDLFPKESAA